ncbi:hypothetical protein IWX90DRAFT_418521 [Phyllosticta citrichinensis]|uniref:Uncharacterized protein n=1 Tax=Phyllosticta citrichinensis TaxID=1130410 RepID=A0ABR1XH08_9PEZI
MTYRKAQANWPNPTLCCASAMLTTLEANIISMSCFDQSTAASARTGPHVWDDAIISTAAGQQSWSDGGREKIALGLNCSNEDRFGWWEEATFRRARVWAASATTECAALVRGDRRRTKEEIPDMTAHPEGSQSHPVQQLVGTSVDSRSLQPHTYLTAPFRTTSTRKQDCQTSRSSRLTSPSSHRRRNGPSTTASRSPTYPLCRNQSSVLLPPPRRLGRPRGLAYWPTGLLARPPVRSRRGTVGAAFRRVPLPPSAGPFPLPAHACMHACRQAGRQAGEE